MSIEEIGGNGSGSPKSALVMWVKVVIELSSAEGG